MKKRFKKKRDKIAKGSVLPSVEQPQNVKAPAEDIGMDISGYDTASLTQAKTLWLFGEWDKLANIDLVTYRYHPDRSRFALLVASANQQLGKMDVAKKFTRLALEWGCPQSLVARILIAGVHNTLGRISSLKNDHHRINFHFKASVAISTDENEAKLFSQTRTLREMTKLGLLPEAANVLNETIEQIKNAHSRPAEQNFRIETLEAEAKYLYKHSTENNVRNYSEYSRVNPIVLLSNNLGDAWAGNTINTVIFRHHGIFTDGKFQFTAFYVDFKTLRIIRRELSNNNIILHDIKGNFDLLDAHNSISLGIDRSGYIHVSYDHHATQLRYRRSTLPYDITDWTEELSMTGSDEETVTYPTFILPNNNFPLTFLYRDGVHDKGTARIKFYNEEKKQWANHSMPILSGSGLQPWTCNAYWNHPAVGKDGALHLSFVWRTHTLGDNQLINNINIGYARSDDNGTTWVTSQNRPYKLPITPANCETIHPVSPGSNLINQTSMALDSQNRPHIVYYSNDPDGIPQYQHLWFNGKVWKNQIVSSRKIPFNLQGKGTLQIPISRPDILIDRRDNIFIISRGDNTNNCLAATYLPAPNYIYLPSNTHILLNHDVAYAEPVVDRVRWNNENVLTILVQVNQQPNHDMGHKELFTPISLVDIKFNYEK